MRIGILGGGQLARMLIMDSMALGFEFFLYMDKPSDCVNEFSNIMIGPYNDEALLKIFAQKCDVITYESENIPHETALFLESLKPLYPQAQALRISQDRLFEKELFSSLDIPVAPFKSIESKQDLIAFSKTNGFPFFVKKRRLGYDGKGQRLITSLEDIEQLDSNFAKEAIAEEKISFSREVSMIAVAAKENRCYYDLCENEHEQGVLKQTHNCPNDPMHLKAKPILIGLFRI